MKGRINALICLLGGIICCFRMSASPIDDDKEDRQLAMFWNLENFYDYFDDGKNSSDSDFSSIGSKHWTKKRFEAKCNGVGKTILSCASRFGCLPSVVGLAEVENAFVLRRLVSSDVLRKSGYDFLHYDSPDRRGIDVALLYRASDLLLLDSRAVHIAKDNQQLRTRDILYAKFVRKSCKDTLHYIVNHHPSKYSGSKASAEARNAAMRCLKALCDSISLCSDAPLIIMGDFNDSPKAQQFGILGSDYVNLASGLEDRGLGSIRFNGKWELIDHFLVQEEMKESCRMEIYDAAFLMEKDKAHTGWKPLRAYSGPKYKGGLSDHLPIVLIFTNP